jgi:hypothetical protein
MSVPLDKAGHRRPTGKLNHSRFRADHRLDFGRGSYCCNSIATERNRLRFRLPIVERDHFAAAKNQIGWLRGK